MSISRACLISFAAVLGLVFAHEIMRGQKVEKPTPVVEPPVMVKSCSCGCGCKQTGICLCGMCANACPCDCIQGRVDGAYLWITDRNDGFLSYRFYEGKLEGSWQSKDKIWRPFKDGKFGEPKQPPWQAAIVAPVNCPT